MGGRLHLLEDPPREVADAWKDTIMARVHAQTTRTRNAHGNTRGARVAFQVTTDFIRLVDRAAKGRGISRVGYIRRAVGAFVAHDLGAEFAEVMAGAPMPMPHESTGRTRPGSTRGADDDGLGFGDWRVC